MKHLPLPLRIAIFLLIAVALWYFVLPKPIGRNAFVTTYGNSMEPLITKGDLVVVRPAKQYKVGDAIAYQSPSLNKIVLHRIIAVEGDQFVTKGDHNSWTDGDRPTASHVVGKYWVHIPNGGEVVRTFSGPALISVFAGASIFAIRGNKKNRAQRNNRFRDSSKSGGTTKLGSYVLTGTGAFTAVLLISFSQPLDRMHNRTTPISHKGKFSYDASVPGSDAVYLDGQLRTGDPAYRRLVNKLNVSFDYQMASVADLVLANISTFTVEVRDTSGWSRTIDLQPPLTAFARSGETITLKGVLDIEALHEMTRKMEEAAGIDRDTYDINVKASVRLSGEYEGYPVKETFEGTLPFILDTVQMQMKASTQTSSPLEPGGGGLIDLSQKVRNEIKLGFISAPVLFVRLVSIILLIAVAITFAILRPKRLRKELSEWERINAKHRRLIFPVETPGVPRELAVNRRHVAMDTLVRLASLNQKPILYWEKRGLHTYAVEDSGISYRHVIGKEEKVEKKEPAKPKAATKPKAPADKPVTPRKPRQTKKKPDA